MHKTDYLTDGKTNERCLFGHRHSYMVAGTAKACGTCGRLGAQTALAFGVDRDAVKVNLSKSGWLVYLRDFDLTFPDVEVRRDVRVTAAQSWDGANTSRWWDTGHTTKGCPDCGHHWDVHTPFRGCGSGCSCKNDPPNQPFVEVVTDRCANERHADCDEADCDCDCHQGEEA